MLRKIRQVALNLLARREHTEFELKHKLSAKGFAIVDVGLVVAELTKQGLQSDQRFVESYINMRSGRGFGPLRISAELQARGIDRELSAKYLTQNEIDWIALAKLVRCKKFGDKIPSNLQERAQQVRYLYYKGFSHDHIKGVF